MDWQTKTKRLERDPIQAARQIDYIFEQQWGKVILSGVHPVGHILNQESEGGAETELERRIETESEDEQTE